ncbi:hypothetical protein BV20DRAFT_975226 [Pilatotrama ljubarskyi]|nr:hypothetical protein BV20DRAFT_975226 [Pilatotrama ljubarskyi]
MPTAVSAPPQAGACLTIDWVVVASGPPAGSSCQAGEHGVKQDRRDEEHKAVERIRLTGRIYTSHKGLPPGMLTF